MSFCSPKVIFFDCIELNDIHIPYISNKRSAAQIQPNPSAESGSGTFRNACQKAADHLGLTIDGKQKEFESSTYAHVKALLKNIQKSGYFDKVAQPSLPAPVDVDHATENSSEEAADATETDQQAEHGILVEPEEPAPIEEVEKPIVVADNTSGIYQEAPSASAVPVPTFGQSQPQPHTIPTPPIINHSNPQLKPLAQGMCMIRFFEFSIAVIFRIWPTI